MNLVVKYQMDYYIFQQNIIFILSKYKSVQNMNLINAVKETLKK